ncbi:iron permease FTR1 [Gracilaria domingensis]|nr:iron permease FTR1 [Gracilaria domingensis]
MGVFSIPAFFIVLREVLEACLVVGIVLAYINKIGATQYRKYVWYGAIGGIVVSLAAGLAFGIVVWTRGDQLFTGSTEKIFEGITFLVAASLLTWMIVWMMILGKNLRASLEKDVDEIIDDDDKSPLQRKLAIFFMVFVQVLREGIETVIFLIGTANADDSGGWRAIPLAGVLAIIVGIGASYLVFQGLLQLDILKFFLVSSFILMAFAAGLVSHAFHELQEVDWFGAWKPSEERDWYNATMWSTKACCHDKENEFFAMLRALFGYQDTPTFVEWATYFGYWLIIVVVFIGINWQVVRASRSRILSLAKKLSIWSLLFTFVGFVFTLMNVTWIGVTTMTLGLILSVLTVVSLFESTLRLLKPLKKSRRVLLLACGVGWALLMAFMFVLHLVQMQCEGREDQCEMAMFFFFGLIFDPDFVVLGRQEKSWPALAVLSISIVLTVYFFGALAFTVILSSFNVSSDGDYVGDDGMVKVADTDGADVSDDVAETASAQPKAVAV